MINKLKYLIAFTLVVGGTYWLVTSPKKEANTASASHKRLHYSATWNATKLLTVESAGAWANVAVQEIPIGVAQWHVSLINTETQNEISSETWTIPSIEGTVFNPATRTTTGAGFNPQEWLFASHIGVFGNTPNGGKVTYRIRDLGFAVNTYTYKFDKVRVGGNVIKCSTNTDSNCLQMRGAYGWEVYHSLSSLGDRGRISASGAMMPLRWNVTGIIN